MPESQDVHVRCVVVNGMQFRVDGPLTEEELAGLHELADYMRSRISITAEQAAKQEAARERNRRRIERIMGAPVCPECRRIDGHTGTCTQNPSMIAVVERMESAPIGSPAHESLTPSADPMPDSCA